MVIGYDSRVAEACGAAVTADPCVADDRLGRVVRVDRGVARVAIAEGDALVEVASDVGLHGPDQWPPVVGDWVLIDRTGGDPVITAILARRGELVRNDPDERRAQVLAANVDVAAVVIGVDRPVSPGKLERVLAAIYEAGATPLVCITKSDLADDERVSAMADVVASAAPGVELVVSSSASGEGIDTVRHWFGPGRTGVLLGESGAGKSSLVNALVGTDLLDTGEVRTGDRKGRHTTTSRQLAAIPGGGVLIDTPGVRVFGLWNADEGLRVAFAEITERAESCRFRDCHHDQEPGCAVKAAVAAGEIGADRFERYLGLQAEQAAFEVRADETARRGPGRNPGRRQRTVVNRSPRGDR